MEDTTERATQPQAAGAPPPEVWAAALGAASPGTGEGKLGPDLLASLLPEIVARLPEALMITRRDGTIVFVNPAFEHMTGYAEGDVVGAHPRLLRSGWQGPAFYKAMWDTILGGKVFRGELVNRRKDGTLYIEAMSITPIGDGPDGPQYFACVAQDVTQRRRAHERLRLLEAATRAIGEASDLATAYTSVIELVCQLTGWNYGEAWELTGSETLRCAASWFSHDDLLEDFHSVSARLKLKPGVGLPGRVWATAAPEWNEDVTETGGNFVRGEAARRAGLKAGFGVPIVSDGEVLAVLAFFARSRRQDETELASLVSTLGTSLGTLVRRRRAEQALTRERNRLEVTLRSIADGVITTDAEGLVEMLNPVAEELTGWPEHEARGQGLLDVFHIVNEHTREVCENPVDRVISSGQPVELANHTVLVARHGKEHVIGDSAAPIRGDSGEMAGVVLVFRDETANKRLERELQRANKLESLGVLAGGIAHDFNNALTGIIAHIGLAKLDLPDETETHQMLSEAEQACRRATSLTRQLLTFSRGGAPIRKPVPLEQLVRETATFAVTGSASRCAFDFEPGLAMAEIDEGQIGQVIHNLVLNASQAMPDGGLITVSARTAEAPTAHDPPPPPEHRRYVRISVRDTGPGVPAELADRLFDPYFTTKERGSGLGLAVAYAVAQNHDGKLVVESRPGEGATFHLYLPAAETEAEVTSDRGQSARSRTADILFMDDEETIRRGMSEVLTRLGHSITLAADGEEAVRLYQQRLASGRKFDVVILDLTVPGGVGGYEAMARLRQLDPGIRAIASSGYSDNPVMARAAELGFAGILPKPYTPSELSDAIARVLGGG
ncbi:MAG: PAS domain S-box protein [Dehalococcoidia bacterium]|nr:PAS domain S-box protein [Dehalococcoidia bacterium]